ncbi:MAG: glycerol-3-phosphate 1-O-acyltransferase PlsY [Clostridium sp.]|nr:glycerol-3-phosphate 1-O-acyltransferase PlsY [Clostridium sp.]
MSYIQYYSIIYLLTLHKGEINIIIALSFLIAFFAGSIPCGYIIAKKFYGINIREKGSGNIGSTNMNRIIGRKASVITQICDIAKGLIPVLISILISMNWENESQRYIYLSLIALTAIIGHDYTPFLGFNGGKGVNTTMGVFFLMSPIATLSGVAVYFLLKPMTDIVFIRSLALGATMLILSWLFGINYIVLIAIACADVLLLIRHIPNIKAQLNK